ncbi:quercetin 2,3-dioxygenase [Siminovitchia sp. 179-K 8D1 HS]|uniref:quercetin 2,3-dioxygenase n=1 Tax=Siminovitchia sp. 179-K 8D1 HS TaxID=3142385 RepID=UPI0039A3AD7B
MSLLVNKLPDQKIPYLIRSGEGDRYVFGRQLATIIANGTSTENLVELVILSGGKGDAFPAHKHAKSHEGIYVLHGKLEVVIEDKKYLLTDGNYAFIPAGTVHGYTMQSHRTQFLSVTSKGEVSSLYSAIGKPYDKFVHPQKAINELSGEDFAAAANVADVSFLFDHQVDGAPQIVENAVVPGDVSPYVLETGEGVRLVTADQLHSVITSQANTNCDFITVVTEGPKGEKIPEHYHQKHTEFFFALEGQVTIWANGEEVVLHPGDFLHCPANTVHAYRFDSHYTKMVGFLATGLFEPFFHTLGDVYEDHIFPAEPYAFRFDRVLANLDKLDLVPLGGPPAKEEPTTDDKETING